MIKTDITIIGAGIAGLWALDQLSKQGYSAILLESEKIGTGQTLKSQGIIHRGLKYALNGNINQSANAVAESSQIWESCLKGKGSIDLSSVKILSNHYYLWSSGNFLTKLNQLLSKKLLSSSTRSLLPSQYPQVFQSKAFKGKLYEVDEYVLDVFSLMNLLYQANVTSIYATSKIKLNKISQKNFLSVEFSDGRKCEIDSQIYLFCAGEGNHSFISQLTENKLTQIRPLHMVLLKAPGLLPLYGHCIGLSTIPKITITSHYNQHNELLWYIGGEIAEAGHLLSSNDQIQKTKNQLATLLPWIDYSNATWKSVKINRAESYQPNQQRPSSYSLITRENCLFAWPTKLTLTPALVSHISMNIERTIKPRYNTQDIKLPSHRPEIVSPLWDEL